MDRLLAGGELGGGVEAVEGFFGRGLGGIRHDGSPGRASIALKAAACGHLARRQALGCAAAVVKTRWIRGVRERGPLAGTAAVVASTPEALHGRASHTSDFMPSPRRLHRLGVCIPRADYQGVARPSAAARQPGISIESRIGPNDRRTRMGRPGERTGANDESDSDSQKLCVAGWRHGFGCNLDF